MQQHRHCEPTGRREAPPDDRLHEAIHSAASGRVDCFASLAMTTRHTFAISPHVFCARYSFISLPSNQRAQGKPDARCTRGPVSKLHKKHAHEHTGPAEAIRLSLRNGFTAYTCSPRRPGFLATVARAPERELDTSVGVPGPHDFTARLSAVRPNNAPASTAPRPALLTLRNAPLSGTGFRKYRSDLGQGQANISEKRKYFCKPAGPAKSH
jgi:hypothetical protein